MKYKNSYELIIFYGHCKKEVIRYEKLGKIKSVNEYIYNMIGSSFNIRTR